MELAVRIQDSIDNATPFIGSPGGDLFVVPHPGDASPVHIHDAMASLVESGSISGYRYLGESSPPVILAVTSAANV